MSYNQQPSYNDRPAYGAGYDQNPYGNTAEQGYGGGSYEMSEDPTALLNRCRNINDGVRELKAKREGQLAAAQNALLESQTGRDDESAKQALDYIQEEIRAGFVKLKDDLLRVKRAPGSNATHVQNQIDVTTRNVSNEMDQYMKDQAALQKRLTEQVRRRYQMANPQASPEEVEQGVENVMAGTEQTFQIAGSRTKAANDTLNAVKVRAAINAKIQQGVMEISELMTVLNYKVEEQREAVETIHRDAGNVAQDLENANTQLTGAIDSARKARRWKWYALIIVIIIIAIVVGVAVGVTAN
ncbi:t-SNARE [Aspergillus heterothallicus]